MHYSKCNFGYVLRLESGEEVQESLKLFGQHVSIRGAFIQGLGSLTRVELAFFCSEEKKFDRRTFDGEFELISLVGNLSLLDGVISPHTHVCLGDRNFQTISGHLVRGTVSATAEILITNLDLTLSRKEDPILLFKGLISSNRARLKIPL